MTFGEILSAGLVLQSFGIVGLLVQENAAAPAEPGSQADPREAFRKRHGVAPVSSELEGLGIDRLPNGTYGWTYAPVAVSPLFGKQAYQSFEMHKASDGRQYLLGCLTREEAAQVRNATATIEVRLFPEPYDEAKELVCLPVSRLQRRTNNPSHEQGGWVPFFVEPEK